MNNAFGIFRRNRMRLSSCVIALACAGLLPGSPAWAQSGIAPPISYTDISQMMFSRHNVIPMLQTDPSLPQPPGANFSAIDQRGADHSASVDIAGFANTTIQLQGGIGDSSTLAVVGNQNVVTTIQQGNNDRASISVVGQNNRISDVQIGSNLSFGLQQTGNGSNVTVQQIRR